MMGRGAGSPHASLFLSLSIIHTASLSLLLARPLSLWMSAVEGEGSLSDRWTVSRSLGASYEPPPERDLPPP